MRTAPNNNHNYNMQKQKNDLKTWNSLQSDIDMFSRLQTQFMEKFFRFNLIDYYDGIFTNVYEDRSNRKTIDKNAKALLQNCFEVKKGFILQEFEQSMHRFYKKKSKSFESGDLQHAFRIRYCNLNSVPNNIKKGQLILFDVKIKADIEKLQQLPATIISQLQSTCQGTAWHQSSIIKDTFKNYRGQYLNIFIVYFGDINFHLVRKHQYQRECVKLFGKDVKLRIFAFFVSKQALLESFRTMNHIKTLDHINDLVIQFYEIRRHKLKQKKILKEKAKLQLEEQKMKIKANGENYLKYGMAFIVAVGAGLSVYKILSKAAPIVTNK